jgi:hypothetical protein
MPLRTLLLLQIALALAATAGARWTYPCGIPRSEYDALLGRIDGATAAYRVAIVRIDDAYCE